MTAIVGILCKEGVVIGSDSSVTFAAGQYRTIEQTAKKIYIVNSRYIIAGTGQVGLGQRFVYEIEQFLGSSNNRSLPPIEMCRIITQNSLKNFISSSAPKGFGAIFAFPSSGNKFNLCEFEVDSMQPELKTDQIWYVSMGSGQNLTDPFLGVIRKLFWHDGIPSLNEGIFATIWTLQHAIDLNTGGIKEPIDVAILENLSGQLTARFLGNEEMQEHNSNIKELEKHITLFKCLDKFNSKEDLPTFDNHSKQ